MFYCSLSCPSFLTTFSISIYLQAELICFKATFKVWWPQEDSLPTRNSSRKSVRDQKREREREGRRHVASTVDNTPAKINSSTVCEEWQAGVVICLSTTQTQNSEAVLVRVAHWHNVFSQNNDPPKINILLKTGFKPKHDWTDFWVASSSHVVKFWLLTCFVIFVKILGM